MQVVKAGYEIVKIADPTDKIERVARICYKSEDKIKEGSAKKMVRSLIKSNHTAMIEHSSLVVAFMEEEYKQLKSIVAWLAENEGYNTFLRFTGIESYLVSGNLRAWREFIILATDKGFNFSRGLVNILRSRKYEVYFEDVLLMPYDGEISPVEVDPNTLGTEERLIHEDITVVFTVDRGVSHEIVRHRVASFAQESTRYCNYGSKAGEITVIEPCYLKVDGVDLTVDNWSERYGAWVSACEEAEKSYLRMLADGATPQEARAVLPTSLKTEVAMTTNLKGWRHFFNLRAVGVTGKPHPQMVEVAIPLLHDMQREVPKIFEDLVAE